MALGLYFRSPGLTRALYDQAVKELEKAGAGFGKVPGRTFHCALEVDGMISVFDIWESKEQFEKFGATLLPVMKQLGVDPGQPQIMTVYKVQNG